MWTTMPCLPRIKPGIPWGNGLPGEGQFLGEWPDQGVRPHKEGFLVYRNGPIMEMVYREKGGPGKNGSWVAWRFRESGPPSTRKGYAAAVSGKAANGGRRAAAPTGPFIGASAAAKRGAGPFDNRQKPRSNYAAG